MAAILKLIKVKPIFQNIVRVVALYYLLYAAALAITFRCPLVSFIRFIRHGFVPKFLSAVLFLKLRPLNLVFVDTVKIVAKALLNVFKFVEDRVIVFQWWEFLL